LVASLPEPSREAIRLTEIEGLTQADAAQRAGLSISGMRSRVPQGGSR
jgi:RNA polymerase sigma-70 factor (ECF subfamily)